MPQMTAKDATATHIAEEAMNAENIGRYTKDLYPKALTAPIKNYIQALRLLVGKYGVPYGRNQWIVPNSMRLDLFNAAQQTQKQFSLAVDAFIINFGQVLYAAQQKQGDMFDKTLYPDASALRDEFELRLSFAPMPVYSSLAIDELGATFEQQMIAQHEEALAASVKDIAARIAKTIGAISTKLRQRLDEGKQTRFHDNIAAELEHIINVIPELNFTNDTRIADIVADCKARLNVPIEVLKDGTDGTKRQILTDADNILARMKAMGL
jgi:hypothetical protein